jgi:hypothetical protein
MHSTNPTAGGEPDGEFENYLERCWDYFKPVGAPEEDIVQDIAMIDWRNRRVVRAETAAIDAEYAKIENPKSYADISAYKSSMELLYEQFDYDMRRCVELLKSLKNLDGEALLTDPDWEGALVLVSVSGLNIPKDLINRTLVKRSWTAGTLRNALHKLAESVGLTAGDLFQAMVDVGRAELARIDRRDTDMEFRRKALERNAILPPPAELDRIIKIESHFARRKAKLLNQLEVLQRYRTGQEVGPLLRVDLVSE